MIDIDDTSLGPQTGTQQAGAFVQKPSSREGRGNGEEAAGHGVEGMEREGERGEEEEEAEDEVGSLSWRLQTLERELQLDEEPGLQEEEDLPQPNHPEADLSGFESQAEVGGRRGNVGSGEST
jgi:hypothetical protein